MKSHYHVLIPACFAVFVGFGWGAEDRPSLSEFAEYNQWMEALGDQGGAAAPRFEILPGFTIEPLRSAGPGEDSWVSMAFDPQHRIVIGKEQEGLLRLTFDKDREQIIRTESLALPLKECRGLLFAFDSLYAQANNSKALFRLRDSTGDDQFDDVTKLVETPGGVGHGRNDLILGPDNRIYMIHGDSVVVPEKASTLLPPVRSERGPQGYVMRTDAEGKTWEVVCAGLRNPYGIDFNADGEMFTYDADAEAETGLPWYRPTRVLHLVSGANYGWHQGDPHWMGYAPDSLPATYEVGRGSPTGVKFGTRSAFPAPYRDALFVLDWSYGRILAVHLQPQGGSYTARAETFLRGRPLNVTDLDFGPDGAMYLITGGRSTQSALYRIRFTGEAPLPPAPTREALQQAEQAAALRTQIRELEALHGVRGKAILEKAWPVLGHPDARLRHAARIALEHQDLETWSERALDEAAGLRAYAALLALSRVGSDAALPAIIARLHRLPANGELEWMHRVRCLNRCLERNARVDPAIKPALVEQLLQHYPNKSMPLNRELATLLVRLEVPEVVPRTLTLIRQVEKQNDRLHFLHSLSRAQHGWSPADRQQYVLLLANAPTWNGDRNMPDFIKGLRERGLNGLSEEERTALEAPRHPTRSAEAEIAALAKRPFVRHWQPTDLTALIAGDGSAGDPVNGRSMFSVILCARCHQAGSIGIPVGPDLTMVSARFNRQDLLTAIIHPSAQTAESFRTHIIKTREGSEVVGRIMRNELRGSALHLSTNPFAPTELIRIKKADILSHEVSQASPMPAGLLNTLNEKEIRDLVAFLENPK